MNILSIENKPINLDTLPDAFDEEIQFSLLDNRDTSNPDFFFEPLLLLDSFMSPVVVLNIGGSELFIPSDHYVLIGDSETGNDLEILPVTSIYRRGFEAFLYNPLTSFRPEFAPIEMVNIYHDKSWFIPKLKNNQLLSVPITNDEQPLCAFFGVNISKQNEQVKFTDLL